MLRRRRNSRRTSWLRLGQSFAGRAAKLVPLSTLIGLGAPLLAQWDNRQLRKQMPTRRDLLRWSKQLPSRRDIARWGDQLPSRQDLARLSSQLPSRQDIARWSNQIPMRDEIMHWGEQYLPSQATLQHWSNQYLPRQLAIVPPAPPPRRRRFPRTALLVAGGIGLGLIALSVIRRLRMADLRGKVVLITGGSRGLGLELARQFVQQGCRIVICARDENELAEARQILDGMGAQVLTVPCDVSDRAQVRDLITRATHHFGQIDILVNNAGILQVGPVESMGQADFEQAMNVMFWGMAHPTLAVLPQMRARGEGRIVNITSLAAKVPLPHLLPYDAAKSAALAFSQGLRSELAGEGITVTTIVPGLMRTGGHLKASYKGDHQDESSWFASMATMPFISMEVEGAAQQVVSATRYGEAERTLGFVAMIMERLQGLFPGFMADMIGMMGRSVFSEKRQGQAGEAKKPSSVMRILSRWGQPGEQPPAAEHPSEQQPAPGRERLPRNGQERASA